MQTSFFRTKGDGEVPVYHPNWYAAFVKTGKEDDVRARLDYRFGGRLHFLFPQKKLRVRKGGIWYDVLQPLFPGYILINGPLGIEEYHDIKDVPGLWRFLFSGNEIMPIPKNEIQIISRLLGDGDIIGPSKILKEDGHVYVIDGPLKGMEGSIIKIDHRKGRAKVRMTFLNEERTVDLAVSFLSHT